MTLPSRTIQDVQLYTAFSKKDSSMSFQIPGMSEVSAKVLALDKIGYSIFEHTDGRFCLVDADDYEVVIQTLDSETLEEAVCEAFDDIGWALSEPTDLIGGSMGSGFGFEDQ